MTVTNQYEIDAVMDDSKTQRLPGAACHRCPLAKQTANNGPVPAVGIEGADVVFVGEAPGQVEVEGIPEEGIPPTPYIGPSGQLLRGTLGMFSSGEKIGYMNLVACRPPDNRDPTKEEIECCRPYVLRQLRKMKRKTKLVSTGRFASQVLSGDDNLKITKAHGSWFKGAHGYTLRVLHPAAVLRAPSAFPSFSVAISKAINGKPQELHVPDVAYEVVQSPSDIHISEGWVAIDLETTGLDHVSDRITLMAITDREDFCYLVPGDVVYTNEFADWFRKFDENKSYTPIYHNGKFDLQFLWKWLGYRPRSGLDTLQMAYRRWEEGLGSDRFGKKRRLNKGFGLKLLLRLFFDVGDYGGFNKEGEFVGEDFYAYTAIDGAYTLKLANKLWGEYLDEEDRDFVQHRLMPIQDFWTEVEYYGIGFDMEAAEELIEDLKADLNTYKILMRKELDWFDFNPDSTPQAAKALYEIFDLETQYAKRKDGRVSVTTNKKALKKLSLMYPDLEFFHWLKEYRRTASGLRMYARGYRNAAQFEDGRWLIHHNILPQGTETGRPSSIKPNLLNPVDKNTPLGKRVRGMLVADPGHVIIAVDYEQAEVRTVAALANETSMIETFVRGDDIHEETARTIIEKQTPGRWAEMSDREHKVARRDIGKSINFGLLYGKSAYTLARDIWDAMTLADKRKTTFKKVLSDAESWVRAFYDSRPAVKAWQDEQIKIAKERGYIQNVFGRTRFTGLVPHESDRKAYSHWRNQVVNWPIQSTGSADITYEAAIRLQERLRPTDARIVLFLYDEIDLTCPVEAVEEVANLQKRTMLEVPEEIFPHVPFDVDINVGPSLGELYPLEEWLERNR